MGLGPLVTAVIVEVEQAGEWRFVGQVTPDGMPGTVSTESEQGRQVVMFGWWEGAPGVWLSTFGTDVEVGALRAVSSLGYERLSDLAVPYELRQWLPAGHGPMAERRLRFRLSP